jgi:hypothetical protein
MLANRPIQDDSETPLGNWCHNPTVISITREALDHMQVDTWLALAEYPNTWDPVRDVIYWQMSEATWTFFLLKYPELVGLSQHKDPTQKSNT